MAERTDLTIPYSALAFESERVGVLNPPSSEHEVLSALLMETVRHYGEALAEGAGIVPVSVTIDVTGIVSGEAPVRFEAEIDRKTRTLLFIGGEASQAGGPLLKATAVYRITV